MAHRSPFERALPLAALIALGWLGGCSDNPGSPGDPLVLPGGLIVSDPVTTAGLTATAGVASALAGSAADAVAYVSLAPGTVPAGARASVHRVGDVATLTTAVINGGFDPVPVGAQAGDFIDVLVRDAGGGTLFQQRVAVRPGRRPSVVRTQPGRGKTDVPMNAAIIVVFSEPVAGATMTPSSVRLLRGTTPVAGTVRLLEGTGAVGVFTPATPLNRNANYRLVVTQAVRDLDGDVLEAGLTVAFTTGQSSTGPAASISVSPDTVVMTGATYQMTATVRDAAGNILIDQPVTWSTSDPAGLTVSPTGLLTALAAGGYAVSATVNGVTAGADVFVSAGPAASLAVSPPQASVGAAGDTIVLMATVRDASGSLLDRPSVTWTSSNTTAATVVADSSGSRGRAFGTVTGVNLGSVTITATSGTASGTASVTVIPPPPVGSVRVTPASVSLVVQATRQLSAVVRDANDRVLGGRLVTWTSDNPAVATVGTNGLVTGVGVGSATVTATSEGVSDAAAITVTTVNFESVSAGAGHTCGLTTNGTAYCWGVNWVGVLGIGTSGPDACQSLDGGPDEWCSRTPVAVVGEITFSALTAGPYHRCGFTIPGAAYCWGANIKGRLGIGSELSATAVPLAVTGGLTFSALTAGWGLHTCGVAISGEAFCWGDNEGGQLGNGSHGDSRLAPVAVTGGLMFSAVSAGEWHTCGLSTSGAAFCWGYNSFGVLGVGSSTGPELCAGSPCSKRPVAVVGGHVFSAVSAGSYHTCGLTTGGVVYCWGLNENGQLGDGTFTPSSGSSVPVAVTGGLTFVGLTTGGHHTCGLTTAGAAYCWGGNVDGRLGDGSTIDRLSPAAVSGGLTFTSLSGGAGHTCGVTTGGITYCWGANHYGALGNGTTTSSSVPVRVAGQP